MAKGLCMYIKGFQCSDSQINTEFGHSGDSLMGRKMTKTKEQKIKEKLEDYIREIIKIESKFKEFSRKEKIIRTFLTFAIIVLTISSVIHAVNLDTYRSYEPALDSVCMHEYNPLYEFKEFNDGTIVCEINKQQTIEEMDRKYEMFKKNNFKQTVIIKK